jgi:hypothetical protein
MKLLLLLIVSLAGHLYADGVAGRVLDPEGKAVSGGIVRTGGASAVTDDGGAYRLDAEP